MLSSGIPCCEEDDTASDDKKDDIGQEFRISWKTLSGVLEVAANRWFDTAKSV